MVDETISELVKKVIREDIGDLISRELIERFKPIQNQINQLQISQDVVADQIQEDRKDISQIRIDQAKITKQVGIVIENQDRQEDKAVEAVKEEVDNIPSNIEKSVEKIFNNEPFLIRLKNKFFKKRG